ncbi:uncharacterized protein LOC132396960 [Hypanus sabinus]|uniref:uncharacterized protein LOC132396960 n=1 Tax=Hypanus sabinus TaxID=79690 RepID=UPI0028C465F2|nr:uncharacterized protein LOC132396960 [Hypanus sabinus]
MWQKWNGTVQSPQSLQKRSKRNTTLTSLPWPSQWYQWATYTAGMKKRRNCYLCSRASPAQHVVPMPYNSSTCTRWQREYRERCERQCPGLIKACFLKLCVKTDPCYQSCMRNAPMCPYWCMLYQASLQFDQHKLASDCNYSRPWAINKRSQTPTLEQLIMQYQLSYECFTLTGACPVGHCRGNCTQMWDVTPGERHVVGSPPPEGTLDAQTIPLADTWWLCGEEGGLRPTLPLNWAGTCTRVMLLQEVIVSPEVHFNTDISEKQTLLRKRRKYEPDWTIWIDSIEQPRGIPNKFKARNEIAAGFEALLPLIGTIKDVEWINYIYYNQQRFINYTDDALEALGQWLDATSKMACAE